MERNITKESCKLYHTVYCDMLNMPACAGCVASGEENCDQIIQDLDVLKGLLPEGGLHHLFAGEDCVLCKREPGKRAYYGLLDLGHPEPKRTKRSVIGLKIKSTVGSLIPVQLGVCGACRRRILTLEYLPVALPLLVGILALLALALPGISDALERVAMILPFAVFVAAVLIAVVVGKVITGALSKRYAEATRLNPFEIPTLRDMKEKGWFPLNASGKLLRLVFVKKRMRMGVGTGTPEDATCPVQE